MLAKLLTTLLDEREALALVLMNIMTLSFNDFLLRWFRGIFNHYHPFFPSVETFESNAFTSKEHIQEILKLTHICQQWRIIAHGTPDLWTIIPGRITIDSVLHTVVILAEWLNRAGGRPLFVTIEFHGPAHHILSQTAHKLIDMIAHSASRWKMLYLLLPSADCLSITDRLLANSLAVLECIGVISTDDEPLDEAIDFRAAPTHLSFNLPYRNIAYDPLNLTHFNAMNSEECLNMGDCVSLLRDAPRLACCKFAMVDATDWGGDLTPVHSVELHNLEINNFSHHFWDLFTFPNLKVLRFSDATDDGDWSCFYEFLVRSACQLLDLQFTEYHADAEKVVDTLMLTPHLETLSVKGTIVTEHFFSLMDAAASSMALGYPPKPSEFLCHVKSLRYGPVIPEEHLLPVLLVNTMRNRPNTKLKTLTFGYIGHFSDQDLFAGVEKRELKFMFVATRGLNFEMVDFWGNDVLAKLCQHYKLELPSNGNQ